MFEYVNGTGDLQTEQPAALSYKLILRLDEKLNFSKFSSFSRQLFLEVFLSDLHMDFSRNKQVLDEDLLPVSLLLCIQEETSVLKIPEFTETLFSWSTVSD